MHIRDGISSNGTYIISLSERGDEHSADEDGGEVLLDVRALHEAREEEEQGAAEECIDSARLGMTMSGESSMRQFSRSTRPVSTRGRARGSG